MPKWAKGLAPSPAEAAGCLRVAVTGGRRPDRFRRHGRWRAVSTNAETAAGSFIVALNHTTVAHVLFTQAISPVLAALLGWLVLREPVTGRTWAAMVIAALWVPLPADTG